MPIELTILIPCLNEARTLSKCISSAYEFIRNNHISGEVVVADNGSTDESRSIALEHGASVIEIAERGYGAAILGGVKAARGRFVIMGDGDDSYDFTNLSAFLRDLRNGADLVMGNRFQGGIGPQAMPFLHRYLGNPVLTFIGKTLFRVHCGDFHCGLRGFARVPILSLNLQSTGMEFASEMVVRAAIDSLRITEVPTTLRKDGRDRPPHLRSWRDGWRHLRLLLTYSPTWLFIYPGLAFIALGLVFSLFLLSGPIHIWHGIGLDVHTFMVACMSVVVGVQSITYGLLARKHAVARGLLRSNVNYDNLNNWFSLERMLLISISITLTGLSGMVWAFYQWGLMEFGPINYHYMMRLVTFSLMLIVVGIQLCLTSFLASIVDLFSPTSNI
jgi:glycosyltransferase involved in cell wall biosynthesis